MKFICTTFVLQDIVHMHSMLALCDKDVLDDGPLTQAETCTLAMHMAAHVHDVYSGLYNRPSGDVESPPPMWSSV